MIIETAKNKKRELAFRQENLLNLIVKDYIKYGTPVSSFSLKERYALPFSTATIRNDMVVLETMKFIEKSYFSSGRIPTNQGYEFYIENIKINEKNNQLIEEKITQLFADRSRDIDNIIDEVVKIIALSTNTLSITKVINENIYIYDIKFYHPKKDKGLTVIIDSNGELTSNEINFEIYEIEKFKKAFKLFSERLIGVRIRDLEDTINRLSEVLNLELKGIEKEFQNFADQLLKNLNISSGKTSNLWNIVKFDNYDRKEQIIKIFKLIEENTIWDLISKSKHIWNKDTEIVIDLDQEDLEGISIIDKTFNAGDSRKRVAFIGTKNQDYEKIINILDFLEKKVEE